MPNARKQDSSKRTAIYLWIPSTLDLAVEQSAIREGITKTAFVVRALWNELERLHKRKVTL